MKVVVEKQIQNLDEKEMRKKAKKVLHLEKKKSYHHKHSQHDLLDGKIEEENEDSNSNTLQGEITLEHNVSL